MRRARIGIAVLVLFVSSLPGRAAEVPAAAFRLDSVDGLELINGKAQVETFLGRKAVRLVPLPDHEGVEDSIVAILTPKGFKDGTIEAEIAGSPRPGVSPDERGFVGIGFRVQPHASRYEACISVPPTGVPMINSGATIRRNTLPSRTIRGIAYDRSTRASMNPMRIWRAGNGRR